MKNTILLSLSLVLTLLLLVFPSSIFEIGYYEREFSNEMYNENLYFITAVISGIFAWGGAAVFYYLINSVSFSRWYHWLLTLGVTAVLSAVVTFIYCDGIFRQLQYEFGSRLFGFSIVCLVITAFYFVFASFGMRWWSRNCRHTPFPE